MIDESELSTAIDHFCSALSDEFATADILAELARSTLAVLKVDGAGVMVAGEDTLTRLAHATSEPVAELERMQEIMLSGPCRDCFATGDVINIADLGHEGAWPAFQQAAVEIGLRAVTAIPLQARGRIWGVLDVYRELPQRLDERELRAAKTLSRLALSYLMVAEDRDAARAAQQRLAHVAMHDLLTDLPVRWVFLEHLARTISELSRRGGSVAVLFLDLDGLKYVNDTLGHAAGDSLLIDCSRRVRTAVRPGDVLARIGGDEFVVLLDGVDDEAASAAARRILHALRGDQAGDGALPISASIGIALTADPEQRPDTLVAHADAAMYAAKRSGAGRFEFFDPVRYDADREAESYRSEIGSAVRTAVLEEQFELHFQPIIDVSASESLFAVEALLRWHHPKRGLMNAADFLPAVENSPLMVEIGAWVVEQACRQLGEWDRRLGPHSPGRMFVNLSIAELSHPGIHETVAHAATRAGVDRDRITLEITETGLAMNAAAVVEAVRLLRELGCEVAIDDFGSGYSSLSRLERLPAEILKIDNSFARDLQVRPAASAIVSAVLLLGRSLGRTVVAEGAEDESIVRTLIDLGCTHLQGYHLGRPMPAAMLEAFVRRTEP